MIFSGTLLSKTSTKFLWTPDPYCREINDDSTTVNFGDTIAVIQDGGDTVIILNDQVDSSNSNRLISTSDIIIALTNNQSTIQKGTYGLNIADIFLPGHAPFTDNDEYLTGESPWDYLASLAPNILRYPGGSSSKFRHPFGSMNPDNGTPYANTKNGGNGILLEDIITFYDKTDVTMSFPTSLDVYNDMSDGELDGTWLLSDQESNFEDFYNEWLNQPHFDPALPENAELYDQPLYINDLIDLVEKIETANPGLTVSVLWVVNMLSEPVYDVIKTVEYLESSTLNNQYDVNVYGVELGNECYFDVFDELIGFGCYEEYSNFEHYWAYVNGVEDYNSYFGVTEDFELDDVLGPTNMTGFGTGEIYQKHDYIGALRDADIKVGIPAENPDVVGTAFIIAPDEDLQLDILGGSECDSWNEDLYAVYGTKINGEYAFEAIIPHQYFTSQNRADPLLNTNWGNIPLGIDDPLTTGDNCLDNNTDDAYHNDFTSIYSYATEDSRLQCAFRGIIGDPDYYNNGNFNSFIKTRHKTAFEDLSTELHLGNAEPNPKEVWVTEWNLNNNFRKDPLDPDADNKDVRIDVYDNTFVHCYLINEQALNHIKYNFFNTATLRPNFLTITTLQNYLGGSEIQLMTKASNQDRIALGLGASCSFSGFDQYVTRGLYHSYRLLNQIELLNLKYVKSNKTIFASNLNQPPTMFIKPNNPADLNRYVYGYFSNIKAEPQTYIIRPGTLIPVSLTGTPSELHFLSARQLYSKSGKGTLYNINDYYDNCMTPAPGNFFELNDEVVETWNGTCPIDMPSGAMCVEVPAYSIGYFIFSYNPTLRMGENIERFQIFPNPTSSFFVVEQTDISAIDANELNVSIYNTVGVLVLQEKTEEGSRIDISNLPNGIYTVVINQFNEYQESKTIVVVK